MTQHLNYYDYDGDESVTCPKCGWIGRARDHQDTHDDLFDVRCEACDEMLIVVLFPTLAETREAAAAGNVRAQADLPAIEDQASSRERKLAVLLKSPEQLPELPDEPLCIEWGEGEAADGELLQVLRHGETEIWREPAFYESIDRFGEVFEILRQRYGARLTEFRPTENSECWLYGDRLSASDRVAKLNASLKATPSE